MPAVRFVALLRCTFDIHAVAARLDEVYAGFSAQGAVLLTACLPGPGTMLGLPGAPARPLARRQRAVNAVVYALSERYGAVHLHAAEGSWTTERVMWSSDRLHPGERGHRQLAVRFDALLAERGIATGAAPSAEPEFPVPSRSASWWWCTAAPPTMRHRARGTSGRLDLRAAHAVSVALAALSVQEQRAEAA